METLRDDMSITIEIPKIPKNAWDTRCERGVFCRKHECTWWIAGRCELASRLTPVAPDRAEARDGDGAGDTRATGEHDG